MWSALQKQYFYHQLKTLLKVNLPLDRAATLAARPSGLVPELGQSLAQGKSLAEVMGERPQMFSRYEADLVAAGERSGRLGEAFSWLAEFFAGQAEWESRNRAQKGYLVFILLLAFVLFQLFANLLSPIFNDIFKDMGVGLPALTVLVLALTTPLGKWWAPLLAVLIVTLFAASKSVYEEIEDRTMLTLMSKPLKRWEVLLGKYLGIISAALLAVAVLGLVLALGVYLRIPMDELIFGSSLDDRELQKLHTLRMMHLSGLVPALILGWLQISTLAAVSVAISTRVSLVVNLPVVILVYLAGHLTRFLFPLDDQFSFHSVLALLAGTVLPFLQNFDLAAKTVYEKIAVGNFATDPNATPLHVIWGYVGLAALYAATYAFFALCAGLWLFHNRELGGAEG
jgi:ABC-type transport system involved in multi-copper enzyme maturation permease subunit